MNFTQGQKTFKYLNSNEVKRFFNNNLIPWFLIIAKVRNNQVFVFWN